jgi:5'(3')-deoxyribonucleotidase
MTTYYFDMDGVLANFHKAYAENKAVALDRMAMANLEPFAENVALVNNLIAEGVKVYILTKAANEEGKAGKVEWLAKYIPELIAENFICIVGYGKKVDYIHEPGVLVDDDPKNLTPWAKAGYATYWVEEKGAVITF